MGNATADKNRIYDLNRKDDYLNYITLLVARPGKIIIKHYCKYSNVFLLNSGKYCKVPSTL